MPDDQHTDLDHRPSYDVERFDRWMAQLQGLIDAATYAAAVTALEEDGRQLDVSQLAGRHRLKRDTVKLVRLLARFGDLGHPVHSFASVHVCEIVADSTQSAPPLTTYVCATRRHGTLDYWWADHPGDGFGALGIRDQPLTLLEAVIMVETVLVAQSVHDVVDGADRSGYALERWSSIRIHSDFYPQLEAWFRRRTRDAGQASGGQDPESE